MDPADTAHLAILQGVLFNWSPPKFFKYKIPLYILALREISEQLTWESVLRKLRGVQVKINHPVYLPEFQGTPGTLFTHGIP